MQTETKTTPTPDPARSFAERILNELQGMRVDLDGVAREVGVLNEVAGLLLRPMEAGEESPLSAMMRLMGLLVSGTEETHRRLEGLSAALVDPRMTAALRVAIQEI